jgi:hypothetical protein
MVEVLVKVVDVTEKVPGYWCKICLQCSPVEKVIYIQGKIKNGVLAVRKGEDGQWVSEWDDSFSAPIRIDCCSSCFEKLVEEIKKL